MKGRFAKSDIFKTIKMESGIVVFIVYLLIAVVAIGVSYYIANEFFAVASAKGYTEKKYFWICFWLGLPGWLLVIALPAKQNIIDTVSEELPEI